MGGKGGGGNQTTTQVQEVRPPAWLEPHLKYGMGQARNLYEDRGLYPDTELPEMFRQGIDYAAQTAYQPQLVQPAVDYTRGAIEGDYLGADALRNAARAELDDVIGGTRGAFERAGLSRSGMADYALGRGVTAALGDAYGRERQLQQVAATQAPQMEAMRYQPGQTLMDLGLRERGLEERYYQEPWDRLQRYTGIAFGGSPAQYAGQTSTGTMTQPLYGPSPFQQIAGLGMTGLGLAGGLGWQPFG